MLLRGPGAALGASKTAGLQICRHRFFLSTRSLAFLNKVGKNPPVFNTNANRDVSRARRRLLPRGLSGFNPPSQHQPWARFPVTPGMSSPGRRPIPVRALVQVEPREGGLFPQPGTALSVQQQQAKPFLSFLSFFFFKSLTQHNLRLLDAAVPGAPGSAAAALALLRQGIPSVLKSRAVPALFFYSRLLILPLR